MPTPRTIASAHNVPVSTTSGPLPLRILLCLVLTAINVSVVVEFGGLLYKANAHHPVRIAGITLLFAAMFGTLVHVWITHLRNR